MSCDAPSLNRVFIEIGSWPIYWYGVIIATGAFLGLYVARKESNRLGLKNDTLVDLVVFAIPVAILFARLYYVIFEWEQYAGGPWWKVFAVWEGGLAIHGALIGAVLTAVVFAKVRKVPFWKLADIAAPSLILGQAIGRWVNLINQAADGGLMSESAYENLHQYVPDFIMNQMCIDGVMYYLTFLYESFWNIRVFVLLMYLRRKNPLRGEVFLTYVMTYSIGRFCIEGMRTDSLYVIGELRTAQLLSVILIITALALMIYRRKVIKVHYNGKKVKEKKKK